MIDDQNTPQADENTGLPTGEATPANTSEQTGDAQSEAPATEEAAAESSEGEASAEPSKATPAEETKAEDEAAA